MTVMVEGSRMVREEGASSEDHINEQERMSELELLEVTQNSAIIDLLYDTECVTKVAPYLSEVK